MEQFEFLQGAEREAAIFKKLIYCIQCDLDSQSVSLNEEIVLSDE